MEIKSYHANIVSLAVEVEMTPSTILTFAYYVMLYATSPMKTSAGVSARNMRIDVAILPRMAVSSVLWMLKSKRERKIHNRIGDKIMTEDSIPWIGQKNGDNYQGRIQGVAEVRLHIQSILTLWIPTRVGVKHNGELTRNIVMNNSNPSTADIYITYVMRKSHSLNTLLDPLPQWMHDALPRIVLTRLRHCSIFQIACVQYRKFAYVNAR